MTTQNLFKLKVYLEKLINTLSLRKNEDGTVSTIYFSRPIVLPTTETNVENNYREAIRIINRWIDEIIDSKIRIQDEEELRKIMTKKLKEIMDNSRNP